MRQGLLAQALTAGCLDRLFAEPVARPRWVILAWAVELVLLAVGLVLRPAEVFGLRFQLLHTRAAAQDLRRLGRSSSDWPAHFPWLSLLHGLLAP